MLSKTVGNLIGHGWVSPVVIMYTQAYRREWFISEKEYSVETKIIQIDFSGGHEIYDGIAKELEGLDIGILGWLWHLCNLIVVQFQVHDLNCTVIFFLWY